MSLSLPSLKGISWRKGTGSRSCRERLIEVLETGDAGEPGVTRGDSTGMLPRARCPTSGRAEESKKQLRGKRGDNGYRHEKSKNTLEQVRYGGNTSDCWMGVRKKIRWRHI